MAVLAMDRDGIEVPPVLGATDTVLPSAGGARAAQARARPRGPPVGEIQQRPNRLFTAL